MQRRHALLCLPALCLAGCATLPGRDPLSVQVVDLEPAEDRESLEARFLCVLRVQNPNDTPLDFSGVSLDLHVRGNPFGSGVADLTGTVPRFGEVLLRVPVSVSAFNIARVGIGLFMDNSQALKVDYVARGRIGSERFESHGELTLPRLRDAPAAS
jgi:hypothetical protein